MHKLQKNGPSNLYLYIFRHTNTQSHTRTCIHTPHQSHHITSYHNSKEKETINAGLKTWFKEGHSGKTTGKMGGGKEMSFSFIETYDKIKYNK